MVGGEATSTYLPRVEKRAGIGAAQLDALLKTHAIDPAALRADDFEAFFGARLEAIVGLIEAATHKPVQRDLADDAVESPAFFNLEDPGVVPDEED